METTDADRTPIPTKKTRWNLKDCIPVPAWIFVSLIVIMLVFKVLLIVLYILHHQEIGRVDDRVDACLKKHEEELEGQKKNLQELQKQTAELQETSKNLQNVVNANFSDAVE
jgi:uncharacterized protein YoxC